MNKILVIGMPRCGAHSLGQYLTKKYPNKTVITDEYTFLTDATIRECNLDLAMAGAQVYIIIRADNEAWIESFTAIMGVPPHETQLHFIKRMKKFCDPIVVYLHDVMYYKDFPHLNKRNYDTHPHKFENFIDSKKLRELNEQAVVHMNRKNYSWLVKIVEREE